MKIETFKHENVLPDGTFSDKLGAVETKGRIVMSATNGGCGSKGCHCSDGHWISIVKPRTEQGTIEGMKVKFDSKAEMNKFLNERDLTNFHL